MVKQKWHYTLSWKNALSDALKNIYSALETTPSWFMIIDATAHMLRSLIWEGCGQPPCEEGLMPFPLASESSHLTRSQVFLSKYLFFSSSFKILALTCKWNKIQMPQDLWSSHTWIKRAIQGDRSSVGTCKGFCFVSGIIFQKLKSHTCRLTVFWLYRLHGPCTAYALAIWFPSECTLSVCSPPCACTRVCSHMLITFKVILLETTLILLFLTENKCLW